MQLQEQARRESTNYKAKFGQYEIFTVAEAIAKEAQSMQSPERDIILLQCMKSQLLVVRPDSDGQLHAVEDEEWSAQFPRFPQQSGLQGSWVARRFEHLLPSPAGGYFAPVPDWDELNEAAHDQSCLPEASIGKEEEEEG